MKNLTALVAVATFSVCSLSVALADTSIEPRTVTVRIADIDTASAKGAAVLYSRLKIAAESVCRDLESARELSLMQPHADCMQLAIVTAVGKIDRPALTAYAASRGFFAGEATIKIASSK